MNKQQALEWCATHIVEWPTFTPSIKPDGWFWSKCSTGEMILVNDDTRTEYIGRRAMIHFNAWRRSPVSNFNCRSSLVIYKDYHTPADVSFGQLMKDLNK